ncbi:hypothetical protein Taro_040790, partial [Colocasia esculenta]|nr:hypothetical protein [Colocasia esculenta]
MICSSWGEFPTKPVTSEAHPYSPQKEGLVALLFGFQQECAYIEDVFEVIVHPYMKQVFGRCASASRRLIGRGGCNCWCCEGLFVSQGEDIASSRLALAPEHRANPTRSGKLHLLMERRRHCLEPTDQASTKDVVIAWHTPYDQEVHHLGYAIWGRPKGYWEADSSHGLNRNPQEAEQMRFYR